MRQAPTGADPGRVRRDASATRAALVGLLTLAVTVGLVGGGSVLRADRAGRSGAEDEVVEVAASPDDDRAAASIGLPWWRPPAPAARPSTTTTPAAPTTTVPAAAPPDTTTTAAPARPRTTTTAAPAPTTAPPAPTTAPPAPVPPPSPPPAAPVGSAAEQAMLAAVNAQRLAGRSCGGTWYGATHPLTLSTALGQAAAAHARDMAAGDFFSHTGSDGSDAGARILRAGYPWRAWGENIAAGQTSAAEAIAGWFDSAGHCANFMSPTFTQVGFGSATGSGTTYGTYWAAALGTPR